MYCPFTTASLLARISLHHPSQSIMPVSSLVIFCRTLCLTDFMLWDLGLVATHNMISLSAHIPLQMIIIDLEYLSFWKWDSICLSPEHLWCIYLHVCAYVCTYPSFTQAPNSFCTQVTNRHFSEWCSSHPKQILEVKRILLPPFYPSLPLHCLQISDQFRHSLKSKQTNFALAAQPKLLQKLIVRRH